MRPFTLRRCAPCVTWGSSTLGRAGSVASALVAFAAVGPPDALAKEGWKADVGGGGISGGGLLLLAAYAAIWLVAFGLIVLSLRRQSGMNARLEHLSHELAAAGERAGAARKASAKAAKKAKAGARAAKANGEGDATDGE
jgi:CcmD family protein